MIVDSEPAHFTMVRLHSTPCVPGLTLGPVRVDVTKQQCQGPPAGSGSGSAICARPAPCVRDRSGQPGGYVLVCLYRQGWTSLIRGMPVRHAPLVQPASDDPYTFLANLPRPQNVFSPNLATSSLPPSMPVQPVYTYKNPNTGEHIMSLLPPIHPEMICLQEGNHIKYTKYGWKGVQLVSCGLMVS
ncbi:hypothetical protein OBBRIDRAFT_461164 [Obba rivulosa]|uniref:Uncharacterized protein n=1 Tax=Obba rivulosa TaxID=1052685 RepID=A0A8E2DML2_9APHY|nr:hypothetical protein OBBRIDRAFT_461164 [Obba rivulosa]